jgi:hypothetical protein
LRVGIEFGRTRVVNGVYGSNLWRLVAVRSTARRPGGLAGSPKDASAEQI